MRHVLRHLPLFLSLAGCVTATPKGYARALAVGGIGCERAEFGMHARSVAIYSRVIAEKVCTLDAAGRCHSRAGGGTVTADVRLPQTGSVPPVAALRQELGRRGILARIARPRGPKMYASIGTDHDDADALELSDIGTTNTGDIAHVMVRHSGISELVRLMRTVDAAEEVATRRSASPLVRACWSPDWSTSSSLAD